MFPLRTLLLTPALFLAACSTVGAPPSPAGPPSEPERAEVARAEPDASDPEARQPEFPPPEKESEPPPGPRAPREFRAAWVATVANINWPSEPGLPSGRQQEEAVALLDLLQDLNFNAVVFQVRPQADALYASNLEPWSYYLSGEQGQGPTPAYDPLAFWIEESHARGLELHAWLNPYRAHHPSGGPVSGSSLVRRRPELVVQLSEGYWWMDPALEETQEHSRAVVMDIVRRYDVDGIHFDDYFYPYPSYNGGYDFPDDRSWASYQAQGGTLARNDWRRAAVDTFIRDLYAEIKAEKPHVKFGLSPFGIWRPGYPESIEGFDQYDELFADARLWLNEGWIDYWTPQLYWPINQIPQSYPVLLGWWAGENLKGRHLWPGINIGRIAGSEGADEAVNQIMVTRGMVSHGPGNVHWSIAPLLENPHLVEALADGPYAGDALVPAMPWLDQEPPTAPEVTVVASGSDLSVSWIHSNPTDVSAWVLYSRVGSRWMHEVLPRDRRAVFLDAGSGPSADAIEEVLVTAVDRFGNESRHARWVRGIRWP